MLKWAQMLKSYFLYVFYGFDLIGKTRKLTYDISKNVFKYDLGLFYSIIKRGKYPTMNK